MLRTFVRALSLVAILAGTAAAAADPPKPASTKVDKKVTKKVAKKKAAKKSASKVVKKKAARKSAKKSAKAKKAKTAKSDVAAERRSMP